MDRAIGIRGLAALAAVVAFTAFGEENRTWLDELPLDHFVQGWGRPQANASVEGRQALKIAGRTFRRGVGTHAFASATYEVGGKAKSFESWVGVDAEVLAGGRAESSVRFRVVADGKVVAESPKMGARTPACRLAAELAGAKTVMLMVEDLGGNAYDHADWAEAFFTMADGGKVKAVPDLSDKIEIETPVLKLALGTPFSDNAVLQRGMKLPVWGWARSGNTVCVEFAGHRKTAKADDRGAWRVELPPLEVSFDSRVMTVTESAADGRVLERREIRNILVGEVWFASGQSNMECPIWGDSTRFRDTKGKMMMSIAKRPQLRFAISPRSWKLKPDLMTESEWHEYSPEAFVPDGGYGFSAIAFYYALTLHDTLRVPVGIVEASWGGTNIDAWTPRSAYATHPELARVAAWPLVKRWSGSMTREAISGDVQQPTVLWNGMVAGWAPMAMRGMIWYQGCSNNCESYCYGDKMAALYDGWAKEFGNPGLKLYFAELAPYSINWFAIQMEQRRFVERQPNAGMAVTCDVGNLHDIHPNDKEPVGRRLALLALRRDYGFDNVVADAPALKDWKIVGGNFELNFTDATAWYYYSPDWSAPTGFEVAGEDGVFVPAKVLNATPQPGVYEGATLRVGADAVKEPKALRYLATKPWRGSLYSADSSLPIGPFQIDTRERSARFRGGVAKLGDALKIPELKGYRRVYRSDLPSNGRFVDVGWDEDESAKAGAFSRIAYALELERGDGTVEWIVTAMDAFTNDVATIGVPAVSGGAIHNTKVGRLTVRSNLRKVTEVTDYDGGSVEMWNCNYYTWTGHAVEGGKGDVFDFNDLPVEPTKPGCGCMQVHDCRRGQTLWAYNDFNSWCKANSVGIGRNDEGGHPDYSYADNAGQYRTRRLTVLVK